MYKHVLIPVALDHETLIARKLENARHLMADGGRITLLTVLESIPGFVSEFVTMKVDNHLTTKVENKLREAAGGDDSIQCKVVSGKPGCRLQPLPKTMVSISSLSAPTTRAPRITSSDQPHRASCAGPDVLSLWFAIRAPATSDRHAEQ
jgi:hypothetical protein